ncbi:MAG TPA: tetratricopeptide repeat protein, partial [Methanospirillum sp.]|nr:tetratricopeptide repeat protein [Methanospirillum sp.]
MPALFLEASAGIMSGQMQKDVGMILSDASLTLGRSDSAIEVYEYFLQKNPDRPDIYVKLGDVQVKEDELSAAITSYRAALARDSGNIIILAKLTRLLNRTGKEKEADQLSRKIILTQTSNPEYIGIIGDIALELGMYLEAFNRYSRQLELTPDNGMSHEKRADVIFALLSIPNAGVHASESLKSKNLYKEGVSDYMRAQQLLPERFEIISNKITKHSGEFIPVSINEFESRYNSF